MKSLALIIGNAQYPGRTLSNSANDAHDLNEILKRLGFTTKKIVDAGIKDQEIAIEKFGIDLNNYEIGLFYFAGHGLQIDGENFLTAIDTQFPTESGAKYSSTPLNKVLTMMDKAKNETNIIILDACRENPYERSWSRGVADRGLAPIHAPKGTIIAFATSPGERALDGIGRNGLFTSALLTHITDEKIPIEEMFKRVRNSLYAFSNGRQTSWEHTSLSGTYYFNYGQLVHMVDTPYREEAICDEKYVVENTLIDEIISALKSHNWHKQNPAFEEIYDLTVDNNDRSKMFLLGRNILQTADGTARRAEQFIDDLAVNARKFTVNGENDLVNGILFEIYFNSKGKFRGIEKLKNNCLEKILDVINIDEYKNSIKFIEKQLEPYLDELFFIPSPSPRVIHLDLALNEKKGKTVSEYEVKSITYEGKTVLLFDKGFWGEPLFEPLIFYKFKQKVEKMISIPSKYLKINANYTLEENSRILFPYDAKIIKNIKAFAEIH